MGVRFVHALKQDRGDIMPDWVTRYWVEWAFGIVAAILIALYRRLVKKMKDDQTKAEAMHEGMRALLRDRIIWANNHYMEKGSIPVYARDTVTDMYNAYHALGGNGTVTALKDEVMALPTSHNKPGNPDKE